MLDGTFTSAPQLRQQLLSIHGLFHSGWRLPLVYGLIPGKTQVLYSDFLTELDSFGGFEFDPQSVLSDFEKGFHNAILSVWPSATIRGCYFHFKQALFRKLQSFDLFPEYKVLSSPVCVGVGSRPLVPLLSWSLAPSVMFGLMILLFISLINRPNQV